MGQPSLLSIGRTSVRPFFLGARTSLLPFFAATAFTDILSGKLSEEDSRIRMVKDVLGTKIAAC